MSLALLSYVKQVVTSDFKQKCITESNNFPEIIVRYRLF
jgi:hypothetical protein